MREAERERRREKAKGSRSLAKEREREVARAMRVLIHGGGGSGGGSQPETHDQPRQVDSIHRRDKKRPNSRVSKGPEKKREKNEETKKL